MKEMKKREEEETKKKEKDCAVVFVHGKNPVIRYKSKRQFQITSNKRDILVAGDPDALQVQSLGISYSMKQIFQ